MKNTQFSVNDTDVGAYRYQGEGREWMWVPGWQQPPGGWYPVTSTGYDPGNRRDFNWAPTASIYGVSGSGYAGTSIYDAAGHIAIPDNAEAFQTGNGHVGFRLQVAPTAPSPGGVAPPSVGGGQLPIPGIGAVQPMPFGSGGLGGGGASSPILVLMLQQQRMAPFQQMLDDGKDDVNAATDEVTSGAAILEYQQAVMQLIAPPPSEGTQAALFAALLGQSTVAALVQAQRDFNEVAQAPASQAALNTAWNDWKDAFASALAAQSQQELMLKLAGGGAVGTGAVLAVMFVQQAITTFTSATNATAGATLGNLQEDFGDWDDAFRTLITSTNTNKLLLAAMGA